MPVVNQDKHYQRRMADYLLAEIQRIENELFDMAEKIKVVTIDHNKVFTSEYKKKFDYMMRLTDQLLNPIKERANPYNSLPIR